MTYHIKPERLKQIEESPSGWVPPATGMMFSIFNAALYACIINLLIIVSCAYVLMRLALQCYIRSLEGPQRSSFVNKRQWKSHG